jgi:ubiquinone/menaquinone biosynthesis C-methylase UbiE
LSYRAKLFLLLLGALAVLVAFYVGFSALDAVSRLDAIEAERDNWQRPAEVIRALGLERDDVVVDLGCGSGYFSLKLSYEVGDQGRVIAEDIRSLPLAFLWFRSAERGKHNVRVVLGQPTDPHLPSGVNAVLISNAYHEFTDARPILIHVYQALVRGGRLVVVDRQPKPETSLHEISPDRVEGELRQVNFEILSRQDQFIENDPYGENWWLMVARKP